MLVTWPSNEFKETNRHVTCCGLDSVVLQSVRPSSGGASQRASAGNSAKKQKKAWSDRFNATVTRVIDWLPKKLDRPPANAPAP